ncbi:hypothetical protein [Mucilaginibacter sp. CSA2-8R]|uniref:hypothetical protein n=1 Tax=Mucilaginibacter sp. CSA2-8R TaxID=3141542 RepID=UPI00315D0B09
MKAILTVLALLLAHGATIAQTVINRSYSLKSGEKLLLKFDYPVVRVSTWDQKEVSIVAKVSINDGESDSAFLLQDENNNGVLQISSRIKDMDKLPRRYTVWEAGKKTVFKSEAEFKDYKSKAGSVNSYSTGTDIDIKIEVKVPAGTPTEISSVYGMVELANFNAPVTIDAVYGGIDASLDKARAGQIKATTVYGKIYSNLNLELTDHQQQNFLNSITAQPGKGPAYAFKSTYGKIYIRKL